MIGCWFGRYEVVNWLKRMAVDLDGLLFLSVRFVIPPKTKNELCRRCKPIFCRLFKSLLGRHWNKVYGRYFTLVGVQEFGRYGNRHAHFILGVGGGLKVVGVQTALRGLSCKLKMDVWTSEEDKQASPKQFGADIMAKLVYSARVDEYITKELWISGTRMNDNFILDTDMFY